MKNAIIITTQYVYNYGAVLQAYGFSQFLKKYGWEHEFLDKEYSEFVPFNLIFKLSKDGIYQTLRYIQALKFSPQVAKRIENFNKFVHNNIPLTPFKYGDENFKKYEFDYDLYISGGDQLFNRSCLKTTENFLGFGDLTKPRISYSTSFGSAKFNDEEKMFIYNNLRRYDEISLREMIDLEDYPLMKDFKFRTDIDGSMLITKEEWQKVEILVEGLPDKYILVYELLTFDGMNDAVRKAKKALNLPVVVITTQGKTNIKGEKYIRFAGPGEFLYLFDKASATIVSSFHGTCFSVIYQKPFFAFIKMDEKRINTLLDSLNLSDRYGQGIDEWKNNIDFSKSVQIISQRKLDSYNYLKKYFDGEIV